MSERTGVAHGLASNGHDRYWATCSECGHAGDFRRDRARARLDADAHECSEPKVTLSRLLNGQYDVLLDGRMIGTVWKREESYRMIRTRGRSGGVYTYWHNSRENPHGRSFRTRRDAVADLVENAL